LAAISAATSVPSAMSAIITRAPSAASANRIVPPDALRAAGHDRDAVIQPAHSTPSWQPAMQ